MDRSLGEVIVSIYLSAGERQCGLPRPVLRSELFFQRAFYYYLMASNLLLRLAWTYKLSPHLRRNHDTVLAFTLLEVGVQCSSTCTRAGPYPASNSCKCHC